MSCLNGTDCKEPVKRHLAMGILVLMAVIFLVLSVWSFMGSRTQAVPDAVQYGSQDAVAGKRVFQAYNCMGCHTIVGNGAYFGPDLTKTYLHVGPAWLAAFLPSAGGWPTAAAVQVQLQNTVVQQESGVADMAAYQERYPGAHGRITRRGGHATLMPNLPLDADEVAGLIAFLKYTSEMNNEGWPPKPKVDGVALLQARRGMPTGPVSMGGTPVVAMTAASSASPGASASEDPVALGAKLTQDLGCMACHAKDQKRVIGPGWGGLYGSQTTLADGSTVEVDDAYLIQAIRRPDAQIVAGYPPGTMPSYDALLNEHDMNAILAYLHSLQGDKK
ncbi:MAG: c-type cytochrome [Alcaligenaceae bacterium]|nr:c-type cytochrome [Alcaligenaceae bacterium]